jgi:uncharacterized protein
MAATTDYWQKNGSIQELFTLPIAGKVLIYAPLHDLAALVDGQAAEQLRQGLTGNTDIQNASLLGLLDTLRADGREQPQPRQGGPGKPLFLGLVTTRGCNMGCIYCDFAAPKQTSPLMEPLVARDAIDAYLAWLVEMGGTHAELHFFGGEPFFAAHVMHFAVEYFRARVSEMRLTSRLEVITNGFFHPRMARWAAEVFDTIFLSLDGPPDIQDRYRPGLNGKSAFGVVAENARLFSEMNVELILRSCVTTETVTRMPEIAAWFAREFHPTRVCFETMLPSSLSQSSGLEPPDPWTFIQNFAQASMILADQGIETVLSTAELTTPHVTFCPVGKEAMIVSPDGAVHACYLLEEDWRSAGLDLRYGRLDPVLPAPQRLRLEPGAIERIRGLNVHAYPLCANCFCRYHCSGGCHVNRREVLQSNRYDATCIQTRAISASILLKRMGQMEECQQWLSDASLLQETVLQCGDRLL